MYHHEHVEESPGAYDGVCFDLDGTLWDATAASAEGWTRAARRHGLERALSTDDIGRVCGLAFDDCVSLLFPDLPPAKAQALAPDLKRCEREAVIARGGVLYPGVAQGLARLAERRRLFLLSNCERWYLEAFFTQTGLAHCFDDTLCHGDTGLPKHQNLVLLRRRHGWRRPVYVGDTEGDQQAAQGADFAHLHVRYGFGRVAEAPAFDDFASLCAHLAPRIAAP
jgi:phosphoglycolate phosphatase